MNILASLSKKNLLKQKNTHYKKRFYTLLFFNFFFLKSLKCAEKEVDIKKQEFYIVQLSSIENECPVIVVSSLVTWEELKNIMKEKSNLNIKDELTFLYYGFLKKTKTKTIEKSQEKDDLYHLIKSDEPIWQDLPFFIENDFKDMQGTKPYRLINRIANDITTNLEENEGEKQSMLAYKKDHFELTSIDDFHGWCNEPLSSSTELNVNEQELKEIKLFEAEENPKENPELKEINLSEAEENSEENSEENPDSHLHLNGVLEDGEKPIQVSNTGLPQRVMVLVTILVGGPAASYVRARNSTVEPKKEEKKKKKE